MTKWNHCETLANTLPCTVGCTMTPDLERAANIVDAFLSAGNECTIEPLFIGCMEHNAKVGGCVWLKLLSPGGCKLFNALADAEGGVGTFILHALWIRYMQSSAKKELHTQEGFNHRSRLMLCHPLATYREKYPPTSNVYVAEDAESGRVALLGDTYNSNQARELAFIQFQVNISTLELHMDPMHAGLARNVKQTLCDQIEKEKEDMQPFVLALCQGTHSRLGASSPLRWMNADLLSAIALSTVDDRRDIRTLLAQDCGFGE